jgi:hypothetical protein
MQVCVCRAPHYQLLGQTFAVPQRHRCCLVVHGTCKHTINHSFDGSRACCCFCCLTCPQVPAAAHRPASGSRLGVSHSRLTLRPRSCTSTLLCRAALTTPRALSLATARRPAAASGLLLLLPPAAHQQPWQQQQPLARGSSTLLRAKKDNTAYMFEVEWTGEDRQIQSGQAEQVRQGNSVAADSC